MLTLNAGFNPKNLLTMQVALPAVNYRQDAQITAFYDRVLRGIEYAPQVKAAGAAGNVGTAEGLYIEGKPEPRPGEPRPDVRAVSEHYTEAMGIPMLRGRSISAADGAASPRVAVIGESLAHHYWPNADPIGHRIKLGNAQSPWLTVVGVCGDIKDWFTGEPMPAASVPYRQASRRSMTLYVRTAGDPLQAVKAARAEVRSADPNQAVYDVKSMEQAISEQTSGVRASAQTMSMYAVIALLLAATGIYAVISYSVVQRTHEIGVRLALGAGRSEIVRMVVGQAVRLSALGLAIGVPVAYVMTRLMSSALYNTVALDVFTFAAFTGVLALSALLAGYIPARRATRVDPTVALHHE
jgi:putative ABC transport system permease protein